MDTSKLNRHDRYKASVDYIFLEIILATPGITPSALYNLTYKLYQTHLQLLLVTLVW